jgi:hypothetical protein
MSEILILDCIFTLPKHNTRKARFAGPMNVQYKSRLYEFSPEFLNPPSPSILHINRKQTEKMTTSLE